MRWLKYTRERLSSHLLASWKLFRRKRKRNCMPSFLLDFLLIIRNYPQQKFNLTGGDSSRCGQGETIPVRAVILSYTHQQYWKKGHHVYTSTWNSQTFCTVAQVLNFALFSVIKKWGLYAFRQNLYLALFKSVYKKCKQVRFILSGCYWEGSKIIKRNPMLILKCD